VLRKGLHTRQRRQILRDALTCGYSELFEGTHAIFKVRTQFLSKRIPCVRYVPCILPDPTRRDRLQQTETELTNIALSAQHRRGVAIKFEKAHDSRHNERLNQFSTKVTFQRRVHDSSKLKVSYINVALIVATTKGVDPVVAAGDYVCICNTSCDFERW
jgi:hypothetical protein